jgi:hypothetical protein
MKDELDLELLSQMLATLKKVEDGTIDQQEGSVIVGKILHKIYVESALSRSRKMDQEEEADAIKCQKDIGKDISWTDYKNKKLV